MKRFLMANFALALALALMLSLGACGTSSDAKTSTGSDTNTSNEDVSDSVNNTNVVDDIATPSGNKMDGPNDSGNITGQKPDEPELECKEVNFGELIALDFVEITIDGASSGDEIKPNNPDRVYRYMSDQDEEKYIYLYGTIKNVSGEKYEFADNMYAKMTFDNKYNYTASIIADEGGSFSYIYAHLDPLKSEKFYISASIPDELADQYQEVVVTFGFADNFNGRYNIQEDECDYLYSVTVIK